MLSVITDIFVIMDITLLLVMFLCAKAATAFSAS